MEVSSTNISFPSIPIGGIKKEDFLTEALET